MVRNIHNDKNYEYCLIGSANATVQGFGGINKKASNEEFGALYKIRKGGFLNLLGVKGQKVKVNLKDYKRELVLIDKKSDNTIKKNKIFLTSADMEGFLLTTFFKRSEIIEKSFISLHNDFGELIYKELIIQSSENKLKTKLVRQIKELNPVFVQLVDYNGDAISNKQLINNLDKLYSTDPSKSNRSINKILNSLLVGEIDELEIVEYLNNLEKSNYVSDSSFKRQLGNKSTKKKLDIFSMEMTYDEAILAAKNELHYDKIIKTHSTIRILELATQIFDNRSEEVNDELMDEEEDASSEIGRERKEINSEDISLSIVNEKSKDNITSQLKVLVENYLNSLNRIYWTNHEIDVIDLSQFLLVTHILTSITFFKTFNFPENYNKSEFYRKLKDVYFQLMEGLMLKFNQLIITHKLKDFIDNEEQNDKLKIYKNKTIYNNMLFIYLLKKRNSEQPNTEQSEILALNVFKFLGKPDINFEKYIDNMFKSITDLPFNPMHIINLTNHYLDVYNNLKNDSKFFFLNHSGCCSKIEVSRNKIKYRSVFGVNFKALNE